MVAGAVFVVAAVLYWFAASGGAGEMRSGGLEAQPVVRVVPGRIPNQWQLFGEVSACRHVAFGGDVATAPH